MPIQCYAARGPRRNLEPFQYPASPLGPRDVEVGITHCGICHSDVHLINDDWGISSYPLVPGHEIVGVVTKLGEAVKSLKPGDRVGIGWPGTVGGTATLTATRDLTAKTTTATVPIAKPVQLQIT